MTTSNPSQCSYADARRIHLLQGIALSTSARVAFFEEMVAFAFKFGAHDRLEGRCVGERSLQRNPGAIPYNN